MSDYYVLLTGAFDNAGDFLIRDRAIRLVQRYRPDREVYEFSRRDPFSEERLEIVNGAKALLLAGGPSVQPNMYPGVFPLRPNLHDIRVPIVLYGAGWKGGGASWRHENSYALSDHAKQLLRRIADDGCPQSVRDSHTLRLISRYGVERISVTGCPALYGRFLNSDDSMQFMAPRQIERIAVSAGVKFVTERRLEHQLLKLLHAVTNGFPSSDVTVVFHHSIDPEKQTTAYGTVRKKFTRRHSEIVSRIQNETAAQCAFVGGGLKKLTDVYDGAHLHIGYRVHAHGYMTSIGKPTYLLAEDGRGVSMGQLLGPERTVVAMESALGGLNQLARRFSGSSRALVNHDAISQLMSMVRFDETHDWQVSRNAVRATETQFRVMRSFLESLP